MRRRGALEKFAAQRISISELLLGNREEGPMDPIAKSVSGHRAHTPEYSVLGRRDRAYSGRRSVGPSQVWSGSTAVASLSCRRSSAAHLIRCYEPAVVPELLQTPEYARAALQLAYPGHREAEIDRLLTVRLRSRIASRILRASVIAANRQRKNRRGCQRDGSGEFGAAVAVAALDGSTAGGSLAQESVGAQGFRRISVHRARSRRRTGCNC
ncbi:Scr1 family TA system antitoxin-like transcriptional regulator [Nocardia fluminea]|uniref:Scr1 family TA system antitoxin-like transcriptional regulator n=1 Tax=Nocardia fluminea TaxID=134984 RepID=UPI003828BF0E